MKLRYALPAILWTLVVLSASSDLFSALHTAEWLGRLLQWILHTKPQAEGIESMNFLWRKAAHVFEYSILSALWFRALRSDANRPWLRQWAVWAVVIAAGVATIDEIHQAFVPSRASSAYDVLLDTTSAALTQGLIRAAQVLLFRS